MVIPLSSNVTRSYPFQLYLALERSGLQQDSKVQIELLRSVSVARLGKRVGSIPEDLLTELDQKIKLHLGLS